MPELPEVETVKRQLTKYLVGHTIQKVEVRYNKCFSGDSKKLVGGKVVKIRRFGKAQSIDLDNGYSIVVHIKLTGQLIYRGPNLKKISKLSKKVLGGINGKHTHLIFHFDKGAKLLDQRSQSAAALYYNDVRKFGWLKVVKTKDVVNLDFIKNLGSEPMVDSNNPPENILTPQTFAAALHSTVVPIKSFLLNQKKIAGVGNIYANDALWLAKIHPERESKRLSDQEIKRLFSAIEDVLKEGLKRGGASELSFVTPDGKEGSYQEHFLAYGREGERCARCKKGIFEKIKIAGRGTTFCPACQKL